MSITFYTAPMSSATPVAWALAELEVPHERVSFDLLAKDQRKPEFLKLNPNGKVPTLVVDGTPMFEALAIMQWLGDRYGVDQGLWPSATSLLRLQALSWSTWAYVSYGAVLRRLLWASSPQVSPELHHAGHAKEARRELSELLGIVDGRLAQQPYLLSETFSLADLIVAAVIGYAAIVGMPVDAHPHVDAWLARCQARDAYRRTWTPRG